MSDHNQPYNSNLVFCEIPFRFEHRTARQGHSYNIMHKEKQIIQQKGRQSQLLYLPNSEHGEQQNI